jgi:hypothetical protein
MSADLWGVVNAIVLPNCDDYNADIGDGSGGIKGGEGNNDSVVPLPSPPLPRGTRHRHRLQCHLPPPRRGSRQPRDPTPSWRQHPAARRRSRRRNISNGMRRHQQRQWQRQPQQRRWRSQTENDATVAGRQWRRQRQHRQRFVGHGRRRQ